MRTLAIGDIHGCYQALKTLEAFVDIQPQDHVITLGDHIHRGPMKRAYGTTTLFLRAAESLRAALTLSPIAA